MRPALPALEATGVLDDLRRIVRALRESSRAAERRLGVSGAQLFVLGCVADSGGDGHALSLNELATRTRTHQSTVSVVVKRLVEGGLLTRATSEIDARRVEIRLTRRGRALLDRAPLAAQDKLIAGIERLSRKQRQVLVSSLRGLIVAMKLDDQPAVMFFEDDETSARSPAKRRVRRVGA